MAPTPPAELSGSALAVWEGCARYGQSADLFAYCLGTRGDQLDDTGAVEQLCPHAKAWENACRLFFVLAACGDPSGAERAPLVDACAGDEDCALEVLDCRHDPDLVIQLDLCTAHLTGLQGDCAAHAFDRWLATSPDDSERERIAGSGVAAAQPRATGRALARAIACTGSGVCVGPQEVRDACQEQLEQLAGTDPGCNFEAPYAPPPSGP